MGKIRVIYYWLEFGKFIRILIGQARVRSFRPIIKCPRFGLGRPLSMSRRFSVPVHVVSPAPWGCEITQCSHHLFHVFGRRARVLGGAVRYSATSFVFLVAIDTWRHPTPYGSALKWRDFILYACRVCVVAHYLWQGEKICLSPYLYHLMW